MKEVLCYVRFNNADGLGGHSCSNVMTLHPWAAHIAYVSCASKGPQLICAMLLWVLVVSSILLLGCSNVLYYYFVWYILIIFVLFQHCNYVVVIADCVIGCWCYLEVTIQHRYIVNCYCAHLVYSYLFLLHWKFYFCSIVLLAVVVTLRLYYYIDISLTVIVFI